MLHQGMTQSKWNQLSLMGQMANVGAEVGRYYNWKGKGKKQKAKACLFRAVELLDLTKSDPKNRTGMKELGRVKELWLDLEWGENIYSQKEEDWLRYFRVFELGYAIARGR